MPNLNDRIKPFEKKHDVVYYTDDQRTEMGLTDEYGIVGEGTCPECGTTQQVVSDNGTAGRDNYRGNNYFANHYRNGSGICSFSEQPFVLIA